MFIISGERAPENFSSLGSEIDTWEKTMKSALVAAAFAAGLGFAAAAHAGVIDVKFSGTVDDGSNTGVPPSNTPFTVGEPISGSFAFNTASDTLSDFEIGGYTSAPGSTSIASPPLASTYFAFLGTELTNANGQPLDLLQINFSYETAGASTVDLAAFVEDPGSFSQDLSSGSPSYFSVFQTNADGSTTTVAGLLTAYSTVPEPAALLLMIPALAGLGLIRRRAA